MRMDSEFRQQEMEYSKMAAITPMRSQITNEMRMNASEQMRLEERMYDAYSVISARHQNTDELYCGSDVPCERAGREE